jgi:spore germination protein KC
MKSIKGYQTINILQEKHKLMTELTNKEVHATINLALKIEVIENPNNKPLDKEGIKRLEPILSYLLTERAKSVIAKLQKANCDVFGIGRKMIAFHYDYWKTVNWDEEYPNIKIKPQIKAVIVKHGILD